MNPVHRLFQPAFLGSLRAPNRFVASAAWLGGADPQGALSPLLAGRYEAYAAGEVGTVIPGGAFVCPEGRLLPGQWGLHRDEGEADVADLAERVHRHGALLVVQLAHGGFLRHPALGNGATRGPSEGADPLWGRRIHPLSERDLEAIRESFATQPPLRAVRGGADGVQIHAAHGTLPAQFLSPLWNRREDRYGGSPENRRRFLSELVRTLRETLPASTPLWVKLSLSEEAPGGYDLPEGLEAALACLDGGAEVLEVSSGSLYSPPLPRPLAGGDLHGPLGGSLRLPRPGPAGPAPPDAPGAHRGPAQPPDPGSPPGGRGGPGLRPLPSPPGGTGPGEPLEGGRRPTRRLLLLQRLPQRGGTRAGGLPGAAGTGGGLLGVPGPGLKEAE